jgi:hypothetical protein
MFADQDDNLMRAAFAPARALEPSEAEVARVVARAKLRSDHPPRFGRLDWHRLVAPGLAALALLAVGAYAVPVTRAAIDDVANTVAGVFSGYTKDDSASAPGRALGANESAPGFLRDKGWARHHAQNPRVIAEAGGYRLYAWIESGGIGFDLGNTGVGMGISRQDFDRALYLLGPGSMAFADEQGHIPYFGVTAPSVKSVELTYESGPPLHLDGVDGGFVLLLEPDRVPREVIAYDAEGEAVERKALWTPPSGSPEDYWKEEVAPAASGKIEDLATAMAGITRNPTAIAAAGGYWLYAHREADGNFGFDLGGSGVRRGGLQTGDLEGRAVYVLGTGGAKQVDEKGRVPLFGLAAPAVTRVRLNYDSGPSAEATKVDGGFAILAEPSRGPHEVVAFDSRGHGAGHELVSELDWGRYTSP